MNWLTVNVLQNAGREIEISAGSAASVASSVIEQVCSATRIRSLILQSGSRTLHFEYCSQFSSSVEHAVTVSGPSTAWMTSATEMLEGERLSWYPPRVP